MSDVNYISEDKPNPGNEREAQCSICGAVLVCLSCGNHQVKRVQELEEALFRMVEQFTGSIETRNDQDAIDYARVALRK